MDRVKYPSGSEVKVEDLIDNLQTKAYNNLKKRVQLLIKSYGLSLDVNSGVVGGGNDFSVTTVSAGASVSVSEGSALVPSADFIKLSNPRTAVNTADSNPNLGYGVVLEYTEVGSDPVKSVNAFVFDKLGSQSLNRNTIFSDSVNVKLIQITSDLATLKTSLTDKQILIAAIWNTSGTFNSTAAGLDTYSTTASNGFTIADLRQDSRLLLSPDLIDDSVFLFKDRDSTGANSVTGNVDFDGSLAFRNILPVTGVTDSEITTANLNLDSLTFTAGNEKASNLEGTSAENFYIRVGSPEAPNGLPVALADGELTAPSNIRVFDINPSPNREEGYSLVTFKWNWSDLNGTVDSSTQVTILDTALNGEDVNLSTAADKRLYFTATGNSYLINSVTAGTGDYTLTLDEPLVAGDIIDSNNSVRVIDDNVREYIFSVRDTANNEVEVKRLEQTFVNNPTLTIKLQLGETFAVTMQSLNQGGRSSLISMQGGSYNPDWSDGAQPIVSYNSEFKNQLPNIPTTGDVQLTADAQGFIIQIDGWKDENNETKTAHSFEILYDLEVPITQSSFDSLTSGLKERDIMLTRMKHISSGSPKRYSVGVRPLQNGQPVGDAIIKDVTSGGGGILPTEQIIATIAVDIEVNEIVINDPAPTADPRDYDGWWERRGGSDRIIRASHTAAGEWATRLDGANNPIYADTYRINEQVAYDGADLTIQRIVIPDAPTATAVERFATGISKESRKIAERKLDIDYRVTKMEFDIQSADALSASSPGIIRVYQKGLEASGAKMEIEGYQTDTISQEADLPIRTASDGTRVMVIDGWDPDDTSPNNGCEFKGTLTIIGRPYVSDRLG